MYSPRWYQSEAVEAVWSNLCSAPGNPIVVLPTGAGKSLVIAMLCQDAVQRFNGRVIVLAHRKELLIQNAEKIRTHAPSLEVGTHSAGLNRCDINEEVVVCGIQSVFRRAAEFGERNLVVVDECHLIGEEGMYRTFLKDLEEINPNLRVVGLTATPYRTGEGRICRSNALFQKAVYSAPIKRLIQEGFLCNLVTTPAVGSVDTSALHIRGGEFIQSEMAALFDDDQKIRDAVKEILLKTVGRRSVLVFCPGVFHAVKTAKEIEDQTDEECGIVTGDTPPMERAATIQRFRDGTLKRLANVDVLSVGFDAPGIDAIAILRATMSPGLFAQMCGRGLRIAEGKESCLILDFGQNIDRHGHLDSDDFGRESEKRGQGGGDAPTKTCPACEEQCPISARECACGWRFPEPNIASHGTNADGSPIFESDVPPTTWTVEEIFMARHRKKDAEPDDPDTIRVDYVCDGEGNLGRKTISEWVCLEHPPGFARNKAALWWTARSKEPVPDDIETAIDLWRRGALAAPRSITTRPQGKFVRIIGVELEERPTTLAPEEPEVIDDWDTEVEVPF